MADTARLNVLRMRYKLAYDAHRNIVTRNEERRTKGEVPPHEDLAAEERAAADLQTARENLIRENRRAGR